MSGHPLDPPSDGDSPSGNGGRVVRRTRDGPCARHSGGQDQLSQTYHGMPSQLNTGHRGALVAQARSHAMSLDRRIGLFRSAQGGLSASPHDGLGQSSNAALAQQCQRGGLLSAPSGLIGGARDEPLGCNGDLKTSSIRRHVLAQVSLQLDPPKGARRNDELAHHSSLIGEHLSNHFHGGLHEGHAHSSGDLHESRTCHDDPRALERNHLPWNRDGQCKDLYGVNVGYQLLATLQARSPIPMHEVLAFQYQWPSLLPCSYPGALNADDEGRV